MASNYKLTYFDLKGLGEPIRFLLSYLDIEFEDKRYSFEEWPSIKPTVPYGKLPILEIDGKAVTQSVAIMRYLGKKAGLVGKDEWEDLQIDSAVDTFADLKQELYGYWREEDEKKKAEKLEKLKKETEPLYLGKFDQLIKENDGYFANKKLSWADIWIIGSMYSTKGYYDYSVTEYPNLNKLYEKVLAIPKIKAWIDEHP